MPNAWDAAACMNVWVFECMYVCMGIPVIWNVAMPFCTDDDDDGGRREDCWDCVTCCLTVAFHRRTASLTIWLDCSVHEFFAGYFFFVAVVVVSSFVSSRSSFVQILELPNIIIFFVVFVFVAAFNIMSKRRRFCCRLIFLILLGWYNEMSFLFVFRPGIFVDVVVICVCP